VIWNHTVNWHRRYWKNLASNKLWKKKKKAECENILQMALKEICTTWRDGMAESGEE